MQNQLEKIVTESGLEQTKAQILLNQFQNYFEIAAEWEHKAKILVVTNETQKAEMKMAREGRLFLKERRVAVEKTRRELKEQSLREGQTIDAIAKILKNLIEPIEDHLEKQEKFIEIKEKAFKEQRKLRRIEILTALQFDFTFTDLLNMSDEYFDTLVLQIETERDAKTAAAIKAEEQRLEKEKADTAERERLRLENEILRKEAEAREILAQIERERLEKGRVEEARKQAAILEQQRKEAEETLRLERHKAEAERLEKQRLEAVLLAKKQAELKAEHDRREKERRERNAPDKEKLLHFASLLESLPRPELNTVEALKILSECNRLLTQAISHIHQSTPSL